RVLRLRHQTSREEIQTSSRYNCRADDVRHCAPRYGTTDVYGSESIVIDLVFPVALYACIIGFRVLACRTLHQRPSTGSTQHSNAVIGWPPRFGKQRRIFHNNVVLESVALARKALDDV